MSSEIDEKELLREIRDLLILQLRVSGASSDSIGNVVGLTGKSIRNRYPLRRERLSNAKSR